MRDAGVAYAAAIIIFALGVLTGCASLQTDLASDLADSQAALLKGSWRERFFVARKTDITAVDGTRMQSSISYY